MSEAVDDRQADRITQRGMVTCSNLESGGDHAVRLSLHND